MANHNLFSALLVFNASPAIKVMTLIHWHALKLKLKGLEPNRKAEHPNLQNGLVRGKTMQQESIQQAYPIAPQPTFWQKHCL